MNIELITLITLAATFVGIIAGFFAIIKFLFDLKKELYDFRDEFRKEITNLAIRIERVEAKLGINDERYNALNEKIQANTQQISEFKTEFKEEIKANQIERKNLLDKMLDALPKTAL
jgi:predicted PurR-regulated permease PerM